MEANCVQPRYESADVPLNTGCRRPVPLYLGAASPSCGERKKTTGDQNRAPSPVAHDGAWHTTERVPYRFEELARSNPDPVPIGVGRFVVRWEEKEGTAPSNPELRVFLLH
jgi:hypothetical protein